MEEKYCIAFRRIKGGLINDHISIERLPGPRSFIVVKRSGFDIFDGYFKDNIEISSGEEGTGVSLEDAVKIAEKIARKEGIALFLKEYCSRKECEEGIDEGIRKLIYAPQGWGPVYYR